MQRTHQTSTRGGSGPSGKFIAWPSVPPCGVLLVRPWFIPWLTISRCAEPDLKNPSFYPHHVSLILFSDTEPNAHLCFPEKKRINQMADAIVFLRTKKRRLLTAHITALVCSAPPDQRRLPKFEIFTSNRREAMNRLRRRKVAMLAAVLWGMAACAAPKGEQAAPAPTALSPLPPPIYQPGELPPLPPPTEEQLQRGRELLDKIVYVIANVPLTDAAAVLKVFGFTELSIKEYATHADVGPKGKASQFARTEELAGTGFSYIRAQPWINDPSTNSTSWLSATVVPEEICVSIDEVRRVLGPISSSMRSSRIVDVHPIERPTPLHGSGHLGFLRLKNPRELEAGITFTFEYQTCARNFNFSYFKETKK
jgi:hypothetical protein